MDKKYFNIHYWRYKYWYRRYSRAAKKNFDRIRCNMITVRQEELIKTGFFGSIMNMEFTTIVPTWKGMAKDAKQSALREEALLRSAR